MANIIILKKKLPRQLREKSAREIGQSMDALQKVYPTAWLGGAKRVAPNDWRCDILSPEEWLDVIKIGGTNHEEKKFKNIAI